MKLKTGDILHCRANRLISRLIRLFIKGWSNHTATVVIIWGQTYILEAQRKGVHLIPLDEWIKKYDYEVIVARPNNPNFTEKMFATKALKKVGNTGYAYTSIIFHHPWAVITGKWRHQKRDPEKDKMVCSEYVAWTYGIENAYRFTPRDMMEYTKKKDFTLARYR